jgi:hypothetical protein
MHSSLSSGDLFPSLKIRSFHIKNPRRIHCLYTLCISFWNTALMGVLTKASSNRGTEDEADNGSLLGTSPITKSTRQQLHLPPYTNVSTARPYCRGKQQCNRSLEAVNQNFYRFSLPLVPNFCLTDSSPAFHALPLGTDPSLGIYKCHLPPPLLQLLNGVVSDCERYASQGRTGWHTGIYSLTKQDISLQWLPETYKRVYPIIAYIKYVLSRLYYLQSELKLDSYQPHVLKYSCEDQHTKHKHHAGVQLHFDKCDYTANIMLSVRSSYRGGG